MAATAKPPNSETANKLAFKLEAKEEYVFSADLQKMLVEVIASKDPLDQPDFSPVDYINGLFPDEKSLDKIDDEIGKLKRKIYRIDNEIIDSVGKQSRAGVKGKAELEKAKTSVTELVSKIGDIKKKADESERMVQDICRDIRDLDFAKKNLSTTILSLRRLHTIVTGLDQLAVLSLKKQYKEVGNLLTSVSELLGLFADHKTIPKIRDLNAKLEEFKSAIKKQVFSEFEYLGDAKQLSPDTLLVLTTACFSIDALGTDIRRDFTIYFAGRQLVTYFKEFKEGTEFFGIEHTEKRYSWIMSWLRSYDQVYTTVFPPGWRMNEHITEEFCFQTREKLLEIMESTKATLDVSALKRALKKTILFENELMKWFSRQSAPTKRGTDEVHISPEMMRFRGMISVGFDAYMYLYIDKQRDVMETMFQQVLAAELWVVDPDSPVDLKVLSSAIELIDSCIEARKNMSTLNQNQAFFDLFKLFKDFLLRYTVALKEKLNTFQIANLTPPEEMSCCLIINTCQYISNESRSVQKVFQEEINEKFKDKIDTQQVIDACQDVSVHAVNVLIKHLETKVASAFGEMNKLNWETLESNGELSKYVESIAKTLQQKVPYYRQWVSGSFFPFFCDSFLGWFIPRYTKAIFDCRKVSETGAEQLIVDTTQIKSMLEQLPVTGLSTGSVAPDRYLRRVRREMEEIDKLVKLLLAPTEGLVETYKSLFPDNHTDQNLAKIMQLKNIKYAEQEALLASYGSARNSVVLGGGTVREKLDSFLGEFDIDETAQAFRKFFSLQ